MSGKGKVLNEKQGIGVLWGVYTHPLEMFFMGVMPVFWGVTFRSQFFGIIRLRKLENPSELEEIPGENELMADDYDYEPQTYIPDPYCDCEICRAAK